MNRKGIVATSIICLFLLAAAFPTAAGAFNLATRKAILADAAQFCPKALAEYLAAHMDEVTEGMIFDYKNKKEIDPRQIGESYSLLVERLRAGNQDAAAARGFGVLAAMVTEAVAPGFLRSSDDLNPPLVEYDGFAEVADPSGRVKELIIAHKAFYEDTRDIVTMPAYELCVNEIADLWATAWKAAGKETGAMAETGKKIFREEIKAATSDGLAVGTAGAPAKGKPAKSKPRKK